VVPYFEEADGARLSEIIIWGRFYVIFNDVCGSIRHGDRLSRWSMVAWALG